MGTRRVAAGRKSVPLLSGTLALDRRTLCWYDVSLRAAQLWESIQVEGPPMLRLAAPVVLAELGWVLMVIVDTVMVGRLGPAAIGAVSVGGVLFYTLAIAG